MEECVTIKKIVFEDKLLFDMKLKVTTIHYNAI